MVEETLQQEAVQEKENSKEYNFRQLEAKYEQQLAQERAEREAIQRRLEELAQMQQQEPEEEEEEDVYVDKKRLKKSLEKFGESTKKMTQKQIQESIQLALREEKKNLWLNEHTDFADVLKHADKFAQEHPQLADSILQMPDQFERQKLAYMQIKTLGYDKPAVPQKSPQDIINENRKTPYYQPTSMPSAPFETKGDFSPHGQKQAYEYMQKLKQRFG